MDIRKYTKKFSNLGKKIKEWRRQLFLISLVILTIALPLAYFISTIFFSKSYAWYSGSWQYRSTISVGNTGSTLTNYDVLVVIDTANLVSSSKLQSDCDDMRFIDSDDTTVLQYWIESGCNTSNTQVWVRIPSLTSGGKTIYFYYGNPSATIGTQTYSGNLTTLSISSCPSGWSADTNFDNRFAMGSSTAGNTGGSSSHTHSAFSGNTDLGGDSSKTVSGATPNVDRAAGGQHTHTVTITHGTTSSVLPPYKTAIFCTGTAFTSQSGMYAFSGQTTETNWTYSANFEGDFIMGSPTPNSTGGASTHTHTTGATTTSGHSTAKCETGTNDSAGSTGGHSVSASNTGAGSNLPQYVDFRVFSANGTNAFPVNLVIMATATPPFGWTRLTSLDNKFIKAESTAGGTGGSDTHSHTVSIGTGNQGSNQCNAGGSGRNSSHAHSINYTTATASNIPPYYSIQYIQKNDNSVDGVSTSSGSEEPFNPNIPTLNLPANGATGQSLTPALKTTAIDPEGDWIRYKIVLCLDDAMSIGCQTFDQTSSQTGWSGQNTQTSTAYTSGTQGTYTIQSVLNASTTYFWQSYAKDPGGSNVWSNTQASPHYFVTSALPRSTQSRALTIYSSRKVSEIPTTTVNWSDISGTVDSGTIASTNGWVDSSNLTIGKKYLIYVTGSHSTDNTSGKSGLRVIHGSSAFENSESVDMTQNATAAYKTPYFWFSVWTAVNGEDIEVQQYWNGTGSQARAEDITLMVMDVDTLIANGDLKYSQNTSYSNLTTTYADNASLTFTPATSTDAWWIAAYNQTSENYNGAGSKYESQLLVDSTPYSNVSMNVNGNSLGPIVPLGYTAVLSNSAHSIAIQSREVSSEQVVSASGIFALRLNAFEYFYNNVNTTGTSLTTSGIWVNQQTGYALNPLANTKWIVAGGASVTDTTPRVIARLQDSSTSLTDDMGGWTNGKVPIYLSDFETGVSSGLKTYKLDMQSTAAGTATVSYPWIVAFTTELNPSYSTMDLPTNGNTSVAARPSLKMTALDPDGNYIRYKVQICTNFAMTTACNTYDETSSQSGWSGQNTQSNTAYTSGTQATYTPLSDLTAGLTYYWRSFAKDPAGTNTWTATNPNPYSFTITQAPTAPTALWTEGGVNTTGITDLTPEFSSIHNDPEGDSSASYQIQVNTTSDFSGTYMWDSGKQTLVVSNGQRSADVSYAGTAIGLTGTTYYWRMRYWDSNDVQGAWSSTNQFTMFTVESATKCYLIGAHDDTSITFNWTDNTTYEDNYQVQRKVDAGSFTNLITLNPNTETYTDSTITQGHTYQYRVAPLMGAITGNWCTTDVASVMQGNFRIGGLKLDGVQIN